MTNTITLLNKLLAPRGDSAKDAGFRYGFVKVEGLRIELGGERFDPGLVPVIQAGGKSLADVQILQV